MNGNDLTPELIDAACATVQERMKADDGVLMLPCLPAMSMSRLVSELQNTPAYSKDPFPRRGKR